MKTPFALTVLLACIAAALLCGCGKSQANRTPAEPDEDLIQERLTNDVPGYLRTISIDQYIWANPAVNGRPDWKNTNDFDGYRVQIEFGNGAGVGYTNLPYRIFEYEFTNPVDGSVQLKRAATIDPVLMPQRK